MLVFPSPEASPPQPKKLQLAKLVDAVRSTTAPVACVLLPGVTVPCPVVYIHSVYDDGGVVTYTAATIATTMTMIRMPAIISGVLFRLDLCTRRLCDGITRVLSMVPFKFFNFCGV